MSKELLRIAFADDDQDDHLIFFKAIKSVYELALINNFFSAHELLDFYVTKRNIAPHIFFLDMNMPGNDDFQCVRSIRKNPGLASIPVIIYSTSAEQNDIDNALQAGATAFITKPVGMDITARALRDTIDQHVANKFRQKYVEVLQSGN